eukprot:UN29209
MRRLFVRFFPKAEESAKIFSRSIPEYELSMAQIQGHLMLHRLSEKAAVEGVPSLLEGIKSGAKTTDKLFEIPIYEHLRRLHLHHWTWLFEFHGYHSTLDLKDLKSGDIENWTLDFKCKSKDFKLLKSFLDNEELPKYYQLAEFTSVREEFIKKYYQKTTGVPGPDPKNSLSSDPDVLGLPVMKKNSQLKKNHLKNLLKLFVK